jgi:peptidoglycan/LPS O-acetylase OafA/YrhL
MALSITKNQHFYTLDAIRGLGAIIIVIFHWQHFYYIGDKTMPDLFDKTQLPLYSVLALVYNKGYLMLDLFFLLSGFVFFWLYGNRITNGKTSGWTFSVYRFTRLYPVHIVTLLGVAILQWIMLRQSGHYFIYPYNDTYHFLLNIFLINSWGLEAGHSFNAPIWSVSVEIMMYIIFFIICKKHLNKKIILLLLAAAGAFIQHFYPPLGQGMYSFFLGGLAYHAYIYILEAGRPIRTIKWIQRFTLLLWVATIAAYLLPYPLQLWTSLAQKVMPSRSVEATTALFDVAVNVYFRTILSPLTVLSLAFWETIRPALNKRWALLGNYSYACYLLHFPLQLVTIIILDAYGISRNILHSPYALVLNFVILIPVSFLTYYYFEYPIQQIVRRKLITKNNAPVIPLDNRAAV